MPHVLLASGDWHFRALVRAQLIEEGIEAEAHETAREALNGITGLRKLPALIVADLAGSPHPAAGIDLLARWTPILPVWIVLPHTMKVDRPIEHLGFDRVIYRPLDLATLVQEIKERSGL